MAKTAVSGTRTARGLSVKIQVLATVAAIAAGVALPQFFHAAGVLTGMGTGLGESFLPMHLPVILVGFLAGPLSGVVAGFFSPLVSFALSGMPGTVMLPFMMIELACYGLTAGLLRNVSIPVLGKVVIAQITGRVVRGAAILLAVFILGNSAVSPAVIWTSIVTGIPGLVLQWGLLPLIVHRINRAGNDEP